MLIDADGRRFLRGGKRGGAAFLLRLRTDLGRFGASFCDDSQRFLAELTEVMVGSLVEVDELKRRSIRIGNLSAQTAGFDNA